MQEKCSSEQVRALISDVSYVTSYCNKGKTQKKKHENLKTTFSCNKVSTQKSFLINDRAFSFLVWMDNTIKFKLTHLILTVILCSALSVMERINKLFSYVEGYI